MWDHMGDFAWGGLGMGFGMFLFWGLLIAVIVILAARVLDTGAGRQRGNEKSAREILDERYARGEIGREEYEQKKRDLNE